MRNVQVFQTVVLPTDILPSFFFFPLSLVSATLDVWDKVDELLPQSRKASSAFQCVRTYILLIKQGLPRGEALQI